MTNASPDDIELPAVWHTVRTKIPRLLIISALFGALTFGLLSLISPRYESEAQLAIVGKAVNDPFSSPKKDGASGGDSMTTRMDKEAINTHVRALLSPDLGSKITSDLKLNERVEFNSALGSPDAISGLLRLAGIGAPRKGETEQDRVLSKFFERLEVYTPKESRAINVRFTSSDAELAAQVANQLSETYREALASATVVETDDVQKSLAPKIDKLKEELKAAEASVEKFRGEANIFKGGKEATGLNEQQLAELTAEQSKAKAARSEAEARMKSAREMLKSGSADVLPDVQKSPLIQNLVQQRVRLERQISELSATLLPGHPRMQQLTADLGGLKKQLSAEVGKIVESLEKEAKVAALREESITKSLSEVKTRVVDKGPDEVTLRELETEAKSKRSELERLQAQFEANRAKADSKAVPVEAQIVTRARAASVPVFPRKSAYSMLVSFATLLFGLAATVTRALLSGARGGARRPMAPMPRAAERPMTSHPEPMFASQAKAAAVTVPEAASQSSYSEFTAGVTNSAGMVRIGSVPALARRIVSNAMSSGYRTIVAGESEMVTVAGVAAELVKALSEEGQTAILIDWSPEGEGVGAAEGLGDGPGIGELLAGTATFEDVVRRMTHSEAHIISSGELDTDGDSDPDRLNLVLDALDEAYDHIVVAGRHEAARTLFEVIQGRFDAGVLIADANRHMSVLQDPAGTFLGFEVADIDLIRFERSGKGVTPGQRLLRGGAGSQAGSPPV